VFPAHSVEAQAPGVQGKCRHTRAKYFSTSEACGKMTSVVWCSLLLPGAVNNHTVIFGAGVGVTVGSKSL